MAASFPPVQTAVFVPGVWTEQSYLHIWRESYLLRFANPVAFKVSVQVMISNITCGFRCRTLPAARNICFKALWKSVLFDFALSSISLALIFRTYPISARRSSGLIFVISRRTSASLPLGLSDDHRTPSWLLSWCTVVGLSFSYFPFVCKLFYVPRRMDLVLFSYLFNLAISSLPGLRPLIAVYPRGHPPSDMLSPPLTELSPHSSTRPPFERKIQIQIGNKVIDAECLRAGLFPHGSVTSAEARTKRTEYSKR